MPDVDNVIYGGVSDSEGNTYNVADVIGAEPISDEVYDISSMHPRTAVVLNGEGKVCDMIKAAIERNKIIESVKEFTAELAKIRELITSTAEDTLNSAKSYADEKDESTAESTLNSAKSYADEKDESTAQSTLSEAKSYADEKDESTAQSTLSEAKNYADEKDESTAESTLSEAEKYAEKKDAEIIDNAPENLNTLNELAAALKENSDIMAMLTEAIGKKVDKVEGKVLSSNDFTDEEKEKLDGIEEITAAEIEAMFT